MNAIVEQLQGQVAQLQRRLDAMERIGRPLERSRVRPAGPIRIVRINKAHDGTEEPGSPLRYYSGVEQKVYPYIPADPGADPPVEEDEGGIADGPFEVHGLTKLTHAPWLGKYAQDVAVGSVDHFDVILPSPNQMVYIKIATATGTDFPTDVTATFADINADGSTPDEFGDALPVLSANHESLFFAVTAIFVVGGVYPAHHVFPLTEVNEEGETVSTIEGVDPKKGFFIAYAEPPGEEAVTYTLETKLGAVDGLEHEVTITTLVKLDPAGRVVSVSTSRSPAYTPPP